MSFFKPKLQVTASMLSMRLSDLLYRLSREVANSLEKLNREGIGESIYQAMKYKTDSLVAFTMQWTIKQSLNPAESQEVLKNIFFPVSDEEIEHYWERFGGLPGDVGAWRQAGQEYLLAGLAFQETCGAIENRDATNLIRQFGANIFGSVSKFTRQEVTSVRLREPFP